MNYNPHSAESIIKYAKFLKGKTLREACKEAIEQNNFTGKGSFGQLLEKFYFEYEPNSNSNADFESAGIELKSSPLKKLKNNEYRSKERLVLNIINYLDEHKKDFNSSSFWKKNAHLLLVFYIHEAETLAIDYFVKLVDEWKYPLDDLKVIKSDWELIISKIKDGKAHELSEGDTFYLGACTKGATAESSYRQQPFSDIPAKQRAFSLKQGYVNHIIASISNSESNSYGKILNPDNFYYVDTSIENVVYKKFGSFLGKNVEQIISTLDVSINYNSKNYLSILSNAILGIGLDQEIEEFKKADIVVKTIRIKQNNLPKEEISLPAFKYEDLVQEEWEDSDFYNLLSKKFFFVFYRILENQLILEKVKFWNMPYIDINEARLVWLKAKETVKAGNIVKEIDSKGHRKTNFPSKKENKVSHVRPHALNSNDCYPLPIKDKVTKQKEYTKHSFWLNSSYIRDEVFMKD